MNNDTFQLPNDERENLVDTPGSESIYDDTNKAHISEANTIPGWQEASATLDWNVDNNEYRESQNEVFHRAISLGATIKTLREDFASLDNKDKTSGGLLSLFKAKNYSEIVEPGSLSEKSLMRREAVVGGQLFGDVPQGHQRQFVCLDKHSWVWHEQWIDPRSKREESMTTRYEIRPTGILKAQSEQPYHFVETEEQHNLLEAIKVYHSQVLKRVYGRTVTI